MKRASRKKDLTEQGGQPETLVAITTNPYGIPEICSINLKTKTICYPLIREFEPVEFGGAEQILNYRLHEIRYAKPKEEMQIYVADNQ